MDAEVCLRACTLIQHAIRRHIVTSFAASLALPYFSKLSRKRQDFRKKFIELKMCVWFPLQILLEIFLLVRRIQLYIVIGINTS